MRPVLILQHLNMDGPAYLGTWLRRQGVAAEVRCTEAGDAFPADLGDYRALAILGGTMSANDPLPSLRQAEVLIRQGVARGIPVIGHCLGGQLMSRALGGVVGRSPAPEVGWMPLRCTEAGRAWFGPQVPVVMQWHAEAFSVPPGGVLLAGNAACPNQAFAIATGAGGHAGSNAAQVVATAAAQVAATVAATVAGPHLALQFHVEVDEDKLALWTLEAEADAVHPATVQDAPTLRAATRLHLAAQQALADRLYRRWLAG